MKSIRTPLAGVRGLGSAKKGTGEFVVQRVTSVGLAIVTVLFVGVIVASVGRPYEDVVRLLGSPFVAIVLVAGILMTAVHMRVGMQVIIEDYVHEELPKLALLLLNWLFSWGVALVALFAVLKLALGGA